MSFSFLNPLFLFGLAAGIVPILIHRLTQRKAIPRKFSAVRLLIQSQRVTTKPQQLKHLLLLVLRILTIMGLALMMARPVLMRPSLLTLGNETPKVLILDNSMSMGYTDENGSRYDLAKKAAREVVQNLKGQVMIVTTATSEGQPIQRSDIRWMSPEEAIKGLTRIPLSFSRGNLGAALTIAYHKLKESKMPGEILILSDMTRGDWEGFDFSKLGIVPSEAGVSFLRIGGPTRDSNFAIRGVKMAEGEAIVGVPARLEVAVSNLSDKGANALVQIYFSGDKKDQKSIDLKAGEEGKVYFELLLDRQGWIDGEVRLSGDRLSLDDIFYFPLKVREKVRVLIVDGDPKTSLRASESYYLVNTLHPGGSEASPFITRVITGEELTFLDPKPYEAFFLLNVARPQGSKLASILESGKPLFVFLGDRVAPEDYNSLPLFPWRIREVKKTEPMKIAQIDKGRDILKAISDGGGESLKSASFRHYFRIEGTTKNLLILVNGDPLLVEADLGKGTLFLFSSSADLEWNDLPLKAAYLPLIQGLLKEAVGLTGSSLPGGMRVGEPFKEEVRPIQIRGSQGGPGIYQFFLPSGEVRRGLNPPFEESDLAKMGESELQKKFGAIPLKVIEYHEGTLKDLQAGRKELWPYLLAFVMAILAVEMGLANGMPWKTS